MGHKKKKDKQEATDGNRNKKKQHKETTSKGGKDLTPISVAAERPKIGGGHSAETKKKYG